MALILMHALGATAACNATVTVLGDGEGETGEGGTSPSTSVATSATSGGGGTETYVCDAEAPTVEHHIAYECLEVPSSGCLDYTAPSVHQQLNEVLSYDYCVDLCCDSQWVDEVACGPDPNVDGACCYHAIVWSGSICMGRPFTVGGAARTASVDERGDWCLGLSPDCSMSARERARLAEAWTQDALDEHASVASFARFALQLMELGAPAALLADVQRAMADEIRHARMCFGLASAYAGRELGPGTLAMEALGEHSAVAIALATWSEGCVGETLAAICAREAAAGCTDRAVRRVLDVIARDETRHAALSWRALSWMVARDARVREALATHIAALQMPADPPARLHDPARGRLGAAALAASHARAIREVVLPAAALLLSARDGETKRHDSATSAPPWVPHDSAG
jgi:hypothetical protein